MSNSKRKAGSDGGEFDKKLKTTDTKQAADETAMVPSSLMSSYDSKWISKPIPFVLGCMFPDGDVTITIRLSPMADHIMTRCSSVCTKRTLSETEQVRVYDFESTAPAEAYNPYYRHALTRVNDDFVDCRDINEHLRQPDCGFLKYSDVVSLFASHVVARDAHRERVNVAAFVVEQLIPELANIALDYLAPAIYDPCACN